MLAPTVKIVHRDHGAKQIFKRIKRLFIRPDPHVKVGFPSGTGGDIVMRAVYQEFGTAGGGWGGPIPERPFFRNAMRDGLDGYRRIAVSDAKKIYRDQMNMTTSLSRMGLQAQGDIQRSISSNTPPPLSPVTIQRKGSTATLIDTGEMRSRVSFVIDE